MNDRNRDLPGRMVRERISATRQSPERLSPNVRETENVKRTLPDSPLGGLRSVQAAASIIGRKARERDSADPGSDTARETIEDSRAAVTSAEKFAGKMIRRGHDKKKQARLSPTVREYGDENGAAEARPRTQAQTNNAVSGKAVNRKREQNSSAGGRRAPSGIRTKATEAMSGKTEVFRSAENTAKSAPKAVASRKVRTEAVKAARKSARRGTRAAVKAAAKGVKAVGTAFGTFVKALIPAIIAAWPVFLILLILVIIIAVCMSPMGMFFTENEDSPNKANEIVAQIENEWLGELAALRSQYEDQGYVVNVYYGINTGDESGRVNNWKDCLSLYAVRHTDGQQAMLVLTNEDAAQIRDLFFDMNPMSVGLWTETVETEIEKEVTTTEWVWNAATKKFEQITKTEMVTEIQTEAIQHADIEVLNHRLPDMSGAYPLDGEQQNYAQFLMSAENEPLWNQIGVKTLRDGAFAGDLSGIIRDLPPGTVGTAFAEEAAKYLGMPYVLGGTGNGTIDCSGLTKAVYAKFGISLPHSAAEQARLCVDGGKIIDAGAARPGDLVFYTSNSGRVADRYMKIGHVGIVVGNGMMIDASSSNGCVVYRKIYGAPILYARPHV